MNKILTTHVGSLPRNKDLLNFIFARDNEEKYNKQKFLNCLSLACDEIVEKQVASGIDIICDGEISKISYSTYVKDRYTGFSGDSPRNPPADLKMYPDFLARIAKFGGTAQYKRPICTSEIKSKGQNEVSIDIKNLKSSMKKNNVEKGFLNAASPGVISLFLQNEFYKSRENYIEALAEAMTDEYETIVNSGLDIQIDCPDLGLSRHMLFPELSDEEFIKIANLNAEALNHALRNIDPSKIRIHICWGNYEGPHVCDIDLNKVFDILMKIKSQYILFEGSNPRHAHEWTVFRDRKNEISDDKILVPGAIDTTTNYVEHPELVAQRILQFVNIVGKDRVIAGSDCGFGTFAGFGAIDPEIAYAKLNALSKGALLASERL